MIADFAVLLALALQQPPPASTTTAPAVQAAGAQAVDTQAQLAARRAAWREAIELDVPTEVLTDGAWIETDAQADPELTALYARALHAAGEDERALRILQRGDSPALVLAAARFALDADEAQRARGLLTLTAPTGTETPRFPAESECWLLLGRAESRAGRPARAEPYLMEFVKRAPWHVEAPQAWFLLVEAARARGDGADALRREQSRQRSAEWHAFYRARRLQVRAKPNEPLPHLGLAQLWLAADELERARAAVDAALALDAQFCRGLELAAEIARRQNDLARAHTTCDAALACDADLVDVHLTRARIARDNGDATAASASFARYRELGGTKDL